MAWTNVEWTAGEVITETKLDDMQGNIEHLKDGSLNGLLFSASSGYYQNHFGTGGEYRFREWSQSTIINERRLNSGTVNSVFEVKIDSTVVSSFTVNEDAGEQTNTDTNVNVSSLVGWYDLTVELTLGTGSSYVEERTLGKVYISAEQNYVSCIVDAYNLDGEGDSYIYSGVHGIYLYRHDETVSGW